MSLTQQSVLEALGKVPDPDLGSDLVSLNMVKGVSIDGADVQVQIELTTPACPMKDRIKADVVEAIQGVDADALVEVVLTARARGGASEQLPGVTHVIAVGAGKGGVGKSTVATLLALGLSRAGASVGLLDGDIYGPSLGTMLGLDDLQATASGNILDPFDVSGLKAMTIAKLVDPEKAMIWRGPMAHKAFQQLLLQTNWGELDYLIVDLPPGTGDVPLSLAQTLPLAGSVIVCTPQKVAQLDARRAVGMFRQLEVPVLGVVENMSVFIDDVGGEHDLFGRGGAKALAEELALPVLGELPMHTCVRAGGDAGDLDLMIDGHRAITDAVGQLAGALAQQVAIATASGMVQPTISVKG